MKKNIELNSSLYNATYANCHDELGGQSFGKFIANMKSFDFKDGDYITLADITYGPKIHLAIYAGYDVFTTNENGTVCNNPETDTKHYYLELMILCNRDGEDDECLETVWLDEEYNHPFILWITAKLHSDQLPCVMNVPHNKQKRSKT